MSLVHGITDGITDGTNNGSGSAHHRGGLALSPTEAVARELIVERIHVQHGRVDLLDRHGRGSRPRRHVRAARAALVLRRLAERLDPAAAQHPASPTPHTADAALPHASGPRPWGPAPRRAPHCHH